MPGVCLLPDESFDALLELVKQADYDPQILAQKAKEMGYLDELHTWLVQVLFPRPSRYEKWYQMTYCERDWDTDEWYGTYTVGMKEQVADLLVIYLDHVGNL